MALEYFTETELRALPQMSDDSVYTDDRIDAAAAHVVAVIEREVGTSFIARTVTDERHDGGAYGIVLKRPHVLSVTSAAESGVAVADTLRVSAGVVRRYGSATDVVPIAWTAGSQNVTVTYQAGYSSTVPADVKEAALRATRAYLLESNSNALMDDRRTSLNTDMGTVNFTVAGGDQPFGYPAIDAVVIGWRNRLKSYGFA